MSVQSNVEAVHFGSMFNTDKLLGTYSGSTYSPAPPAWQAGYTYVDIPTGIPESTFFHGIFSTDGGVTWLDFNSEIPRGNTTQTITCYGVSQPNNFKIAVRNQSDYGTGGTSYAYNVLYKVVLFAKSTQGAVSPQPIGSNLYFDSRYNYHKIAKEGIESMYVAPSGGTTLKTIYHGLGYVPHIKMYYEFTTTSGNTVPTLGTASGILGIYDHGLFIGGDAYAELYIDTQNIYLRKTSGSNPNPIMFDVHYRIYHDR